MKTIIKPITIALCLALGAATPALADRGYGRDHYRPAPRHHYDGGHHGGHGWAGAAALLAITGIVAGIAASNNYTPAPAYEAAQPVYVEPQPTYAAPSAPAAGYWHYCGSAGQYYPYVSNCPEGWQPVPAR